MPSESSSPKKLSQLATDKFRNFWNELWRVRWMCVMAVGVIMIRAWHLLPDTSATLLILYKPSLAAVGFIAAHVGYQQAFPYINQQEQLLGAFQADAAETRQQFVLLFIGTSILRGMIYAAFILGVTLGL